VKLGIFGGTFDPPHIGHLIVAQDATTVLGLDRVVFIPAAEPPHKRGETITEASVRLAMVRAAVAEVDEFEADDLELRRGGSSWTVDTVREIAGRSPSVELFLLLGSDQYTEFETWRDPAGILRLARLAVLTREGGDVHLDGALAVRVTRIDLSSTDIRRRVAAGEPVRFLVPAAVETIIRKHGLYTVARSGAVRTGMAPPG